MTRTDYITKKKIATAFHTVVLKTGFDHTSVTGIMDTAKIRRQSFYDYFQDKYELLVWYVTDELDETIENNFDYLSWREIIKATCAELSEDRRFYADVMACQHEIDITDLVAAHLRDLLHHQLADWAQKTPAAQHLIDLVVLGIAYRMVANLLVNDPAPDSQIVTLATETIALVLTKSAATQKNEPK